MATYSPVIYWCTFFFSILRHTLPVIVNLLKTTYTIKEWWKIISKWCPQKNISSVCFGTDMYMVIKSWTFHYCKHSSKSFRKMGSSKVLDRAEDNVPWQSCEGNISIWVAQKTMGQFTNESQNLLTWEIKFDKSILCNAEVNLYSIFTQHNIFTLMHRSITANVLKKIFTPEICSQNSHREMMCVNFNAFHF